MDHRDRSDMDRRIVVTPLGCLNLTVHFRFQVSWLKRYGDTPHLLTFGLTTYSSDARFQVNNLTLNYYDYLA